ncbi:MAG TPA: hypothetical protein EYG71_04700 [Leucothrix sp.]|nr:hypothetical protein [Leucothrix sp.]
MSIKNDVIQQFIAGDYEQIHCEKCEMTFLTNVYMFDDNHVLLEKRSLGLEYYCGAIHQQGLKKVPDIQRVGILDEDDNIVEGPSQDVIYSGDETDLRFIYVMEKLKHLDEDDSAYFDKCIHSFDWKSETDRAEIIAGVTKRYNAELAQDILQLYHFYKKHDGVLAWDLHGDNLMQRLNSDEIVILDPYTRQC